MGDAPTSRRPSLSGPDVFLPNLGLATTRELLLEIKARGECEFYYREEGDAMAIRAANLLDSLPSSMLDYDYFNGPGEE